MKIGYILHKVVNNKVRLYFKPLGQENELAGGFLVNAVIYYKNTTKGVSNG
jgi:hypothetical protein